MNRLDLNLFGKGKAHLAPTLMACIVVGLACLMLVGGVLGQPTPISEDDYWQRMAQSETLLERALNESDREAALEDLRDLWDGVSAVQVDDQVMQVNMDWLQNPPSNTDVFEDRLNQVRGLLSYHERLSGEANPPSQETLNQVLQDPRFQYPTPTPQPFQPESENTGPNLNFNIAPEVAQLLLAIGGIAIVVVVFMFIARSLRLQRAAVEIHPEEDDPPTSEDASQRAGESEASRDYRSAIRYLYLACLLLLDERGLIRYDRTLTNREHLRIVSDKPQLVELLRPVITTFDDVWYGFMPVDEDMYQQFSQNVERLKRLAA